jgi:hypothetical protein
MDDKPKALSTAKTPSSQ